MLSINETLTIPLTEIELSAIRSQGPGGQNVNKVATAIHLRFDINASNALGDEEKQCLLRSKDRRISSDGIINIKAQRARKQEKNRSDALNRLAELIRKALVKQKPRKKTKPSRKAKEKRLADKAHRARVKRTRNEVTD